MDLDQEPLLLSCPAAAAATLVPSLFKLRLVLWTPNLVHTLGAHKSIFEKKKFGLT